MNRLKPILQSDAIKAVLIAGLLFVWISGCSKTTVLNDTLSLDLTDINGDPVSLEEEKFKDKVVLVNIWGTWCPPCQAELPHLIALQEKYRDRGFEIIGVDFEGQTTASNVELEASLREMVKGRGINYTIVLGGAGVDVSEVLPGVQNFQGYPTNIYIGRDGKVNKITTGFSEGQVPAMEKTIESLLGS